MCKNSNQEIFFVFLIVPITLQLPVSSSFLFFIFCQQTLCILEPPGSLTSLVLLVCPILFFMYPPFPAVSSPLPLSQEHTVLRDICSVFHFGFVALHLVLQTALSWPLHYSFYRPLTLLLVFSGSKLLSYQSSRSVEHIDAIVLIPCFLIKPSFWG